MKTLGARLLLLAREFFKKMGGIPDFEECMA